MQETPFSKISFSDLEKVHINHILNDIRNYDNDYILNNSKEYLIKHFEEKFLIKPIKIMSKKAYTDKPPQFKQISREEFAGYRSYQYLELTMHVPFEGDPALFQVRPTYYKFNISNSLKDTTINENEIILPYNISVPNDYHVSKKVNIKNGEYDNDIKMISENATSLNSDIKNLNEKVKITISREVKEKQKMASSSKAFIQSMNIPIKKPKHETINYNTKSKKVKKKIRHVSQNKQKIRLGSSKYEDTLIIIKDMAITMERDPSTFANLKEEEIRGIILTMLNGKYKGNALGETLNGKGKTDIIIRQKNQNILIAECKFWKGQKNLEKALEQLFGYITWRDSNTAIIIFNQGKDSSYVINKSIKTIEEHPKFKSKYKLKNKELIESKTAFGYKLQHPSDKNKEILLTLMIFQVTQP